MAAGSEKVVCDEVVAKLEGMAKIGMNKASRRKSPGLEALAAAVPSAIDEAALSAGLKARLLERLRDARIPEGHKQAVHLAEITGRAYQTTRRWIDGSAPGLPDLASFKLLCTGMDGDPSWLLGLAGEKRSLRQALAVEGPAPPIGEGAEDWVQEVASEVRDQMYGCRARRMHGDEMDPDIGDGDTLFIDFDINEFRGNGNYLIACDGRELVRKLEYRLGTGLVLGCVNTQYPETVIKDAAESIRRQLRVLGRVEGVIQVRKFWRGSARQPPR